MDARVRVRGGDEAHELASLRRWLQDEDALRGRVDLVYTPARESDLGGAFDFLAVAIGSSGVGLALARSLATWLETRRSIVTITVSRDGYSVEVSSTDVDEALPLLRETLRANDEP